MVKKINLIFIRSHKEIENSLLQILTKKMAKYL